MANKNKNENKNDVEPKTSEKIVPKDTKSEVPTPDVQEPTNDKVEDTNIVNNTKSEVPKPDVVEPNASETNEAENEAELTKIANTINVGDKVMLREGAMTVTGQPIPNFAFKNVYTVNKILRDRIVIKCGYSLSYGVYPDDIIITVS